MVGVRSRASAGLPPRFSNRADERRSSLGDEYLSVEHLLLAMTDMVGVAGRPCSTPCAMSGGATV